MLIPLAVVTIGVLTGLTLPAFGQVTTPPAPFVGLCTFPPSSITSLLVEYPRTLDELKTTLPAAPLPDSVIEALNQGMVLHDRITYDSTSNQLRNVIFLVDPNLPIPTPSSYDIASNTILFIDVAVERVYLSCKPYAAATIVGVIRRGVPLLGDPAGATYIFSFGYNTASTDPSMVFRDIASVSAGLGVQYHNFAFGSITLDYWPGEEPSQ
jgi:hypothetical protein